MKVLLIALLLLAAEPEEKAESSGDNDRTNNANHNSHNLASAEPLALDGNLRAIVCRGAGSSRTDRDSFDRTICCDGLD